MERDKYLLPFSVKTDRAQIWIFMNNGFLDKSRLNLTIPDNSPWLRHVDSIRTDFSVKTDTPGVTPIVICHIDKLSKETYTSLIKLLISMHAEPPQPWLS